MSLFPSKESMDGELSVHIGRLSASWSVPLLLLWVSRSRTFAASTNVSWLVAGMLHEWEATVGGVETGVCNPTTAFVLLGASSFAFHVDSRLGSPAHALDIFMGWVVVSQLAYVAVATFVAHVLQPFIDPSRLRLLSLAGACAWAAAVVLLASHYETVKSKQIWLYSSLGGVSIAVGGACRVLLTDNEQGKRPIEAWRIAAYEALVLLLLLISAVHAQCELVGARYTVDEDPREYDLFHGVWHLHTSSLFSIAHHRLRRVALDAEAHLCVCQQSWTEFAGLAGLAFFAVATLLVKELRASVEAAEILVSVSLCPVLLHAAWTLVRRRAFRCICHLS